MNPSASGDASALSLIESLLRSRGAIAPELIDARTVESLARARCAARAAISLDAYAHALQSDPSEVDRLIGEIAVPETWFFRYMGSFELLRSLLCQGPSVRPRSARILSVGCAAGCEPVSIVITALSAGIEPERLEVIAADRNPQAVRDAQQGRWPLHALREGLPEWSAPWIRASCDEARQGATSAAHVDPSVLERIRWCTGDATAGDIVEPGSCDAVFCRNVLIYLDAAAREAMLSRITSAMASDGTLFLGHAESMVGRAGLEPAGVPGAFAWRRASPKARPPAMRHAQTHASAAQAHADAAAPSARHPAPCAVRESPARNAAMPVGGEADARHAPLPSGDSPSHGRVGGAAHQALMAAKGALARGDAAAARSGLLSLSEAISRGQHALHADEIETVAGLLCSIGELDAAFALYSRIVFLDPSHDRALLAMAELAETRGRADEAARHRERLCRLVARKDGRDRE